MLKYGKMDIDLQVRLAAFNWLTEQVNLHGDVLSKKLLEQGFEFQGQRISLISPQGIYTPKNFPLPIAFHTVPEGPYNDGIGPDNLLAYKYRGKDPNHRDNVGLRKAMELKRPLAYFHGIVPGRYLAIWPVYIVTDIPDMLTFKAVLDDVATVALEENVSSRFVSDGTEVRRTYITATVKVRVHQRSFRERVVKAYNSQCAFCRLKHQELLDAAHIIPDSSPEGEPVITNGIALCKLHHAAYDSFMIGVTPDYMIHVREDILEEEDGPVLQHGLKGVHQTKLILPSLKSHYPSREALEWRYSKFTRAG